MSSGQFKQTYSGSLPGLLSGDRSEPHLWHSLGFIRESSTWCSSKIFKICSVESLPVGGLEGI